MDSRSDKAAIPAPDAESAAPETPAPPAAPSCCRAWVRYAPRQEMPCQLLALLDDECWPARVHDLSAGGVGLTLDRELDIGRVVLVELVSASGFFSRQLLTRIVHLTSLTDGRHLLGGEFISGELPAAELRFLLS